MAFNKTVRVRFAPSPTGFLHIGGARTALFNWLFARHHQGKFVLRIEDTDIERLQEDAITSIYDGLHWLGLDWDEGPDVGGPFAPYQQSQRLELYRDYAQRLLQEDKAYWCYCTPAELEAEKQAALARGEPPKYSGRCRQLTQARRALFINEGRRPGIRFRMPEVDIEINDIIRGRTVFKTETQGDFIILRQDGRPTYHLANVVDDALMQVNYVIRGEDLYPSTPRHLALYQAFGFPVPQFAHLPMILAPDRSKLSKRYGAVSVTWYRDEGFLPEAMVNYLALLGWSPPDEQELKSLPQIVAEFSLERVAKAGAIFDLEKLKHINGVKIRTLPLELVAEYARNFFEKAGFNLSAMQNAEYLEMIKLTRDSVEVLKEFPAKCRLFFTPPDYSTTIIAELRQEKTVRLFRRLAECLNQQAEFNLEVAKQCLNRVGKELNLKGKDLYHPVRLALTGSESGPELVGVIRVLGKEGVIQRLEHCLSCLNSSVN